MALSAGEKLGPYEILAKLGEGGMGVVYNARDTRLDRLVAIKALPREMAADPIRVRRFEREARAASALNHPNIVTIHDIVYEDGAEFIVMELVAGKTLREVLERRLPLADVFKYGVQLADAVAVAHAAGIVHRDLKPRNVMVTPAGLLKVLDFGLTKLLSRGEAPGEEATLSLEANTPSGAVLGSPGYLSPEQAEGKLVDARTDIFSFGAVLYEMTTGQRAFAGKSAASMIAATLKEEPKPPAQVVPGLPSELERLILRCLRKPPDRRWQNMADVRIALAELKADHESGVLQIGQQAAPAALRPRMRWVLAIVAALAVASSVVLVTKLTSPAVAPLRPVPLTSALGQELEPSLSPDGNQVAYSWNGEDQDNFDVYVKLIGPGTPLRLTTNPARDSSPAWSRDGRSIAFLRETTRGISEVIVIPPLGGPERIVGEVASWPAPLRAYPGPHLCWSADGQGLIVSDRKVASEAFGLYYLSLGTHQSRKITEAPVYTSGDTAPALSPDGKTLVFRRCKGFGAGELYSQRLNNRMEAVGSAVSLAPGAVSPASPAWTPDGRQILYSDGYYYRPELKRIVLPWLAGWGGRQESLGFWSGAFVSTAGHAPNVVFAQATFDSNIWELRREGTGKPPTAVKLIASTQMDTGAQYSPDGRRITFVSQRSGGAEIWICDRDGRNAVQLTTFGDAAAPRFSPDGSEIALLARFHGLEKIYVVRATGGEPRQLTTGPGRDQTPSWSRDGKYVYFRSSLSGGSEIWRIAAGGGEAVQMTRRGGEVALEGADGAIYYSRRTGDDWSLWKLAAGQEVAVLPSVYPHTNFFMVDSGIYFTPHPGPDGGTSVQFYRLADGRTEEIAKLPKPIWFGLSVAPDQRSILFTQIDREESNLMVVERLQ